MCVSEGLHGTPEMANARFRGWLTEQLHGLLGTQPRWVEEKDGRFALYYS